MRFASWVRLRRLKESLEKAGELGLPDTESEVIDESTCSFMKLKIE